LVRRMQERLLPPEIEWPSEYVNSRTGKTYHSHNDDERSFVYSDEPKHALLKGGWGAGKSAAGYVKTLGRLRRGMDCIAVSPDFEHFRKSLWPVIREWTPWDCVVDKHKYKSELEFEPRSADRLVFTSGALLYYGGIKAASSWFGGNVHFVLFDEAASYPDASALKSLTSRARLMGPDGEPPQVAITTTPEKNWLHDYFGPARGEDDEFARFKSEAFVGTVLTSENLENLDPDYADAVRSTLTETEARQYLEAGWEDVSKVDKFVNIVWWDQCRADIPPLTGTETMVIALDAAKGGATNVPDAFAVIAVTRAPGDKARVAVRYAGIWLPPEGGLLDFDPIKAEVLRLCRDFAVIEVAYDPYQLHDFGTQLRKQGFNAKEFGQGKDRLIADKLLQDRITSRGIIHDGNPLLRRHVDNADIKKSSVGIRLVKRSESKKIDAAVALSMACARLLYFNPV